MKKIGLVGGTGPESTLMYYKELNSRIDKITNSKQMPEINIESVDFRKAWDFVANKNYKALADYLSEKIINLKNSGCEIITLTAGTMHIVYEEIVKNTNIELVSIPKVICEEILNKKYSKVGMLGTIFTMEQDFLKKDLQNAGIEVIVPEKDDRELIAKRILKELEFQQIITKMKSTQGIQAVILGCTELPLLLNPKNCPVDCLDSVELHIQKLIKLAM